MRLCRYPRGVVVETPAKVNLFFEVLGRRSDGFHEIETLVYPIDWYDALYAEPAAGERIAFYCRRPEGCIPTPGTTDVPEGPENLVVRAVELLRRRAGVSTGASLRLIKRVPSAAGLGGGSSDAAAALVAVNTLWNLGWSRAALASLGGELGSDVPLFFAQGPVVCRGRGERLEPVALPGALHLVVVRPPEGLATPAVYRACRPGDPPRTVAPLREALARGDLGAAGRAMFNRLEAAAETLSPWIARLRREFAALGCLGSQMSGSGTCYFGLCRHAAHARGAAGRLRARGVGWVRAVRAGHY